MPDPGLYLGWGWGYKYEHVSSVVTVGEGGISTVCQLPSHSFKSVREQRQEGRYPLRGGENHS